jgi:hypothetical protein
MHMNIFRRFVFNPKTMSDQPDPHFRYSSREYDRQIGCIFGGLALCFVAFLVAALFVDATGKGWIWMAIFAAFFVGLAVLVMQSPQVVIDREGFHHPKAEQAIQWRDVAGLRLARGYRSNRQLIIWLKEPEKHQACIRAWFSERVRGTRESPLVFWLDRTNADYVWHNVKALIGDTGSTETGTN